MRPDLAALTPEAAAALSNRGLVKRALREIGEGQRPSLHEETDGTVVATFPGGPVARLPPGRTLAEGACTCGAPTVCRHRVAAALLYATDAGQVPATGPAPSDEELAEFVGPAAWRRARAARASGADAEVMRGREVVVRLPAATVRFLSSTLALARCDCAAGPRCEHVALAALALRAADGTPGRVRVGHREEIDAMARRLVDDASALAGDLLAHGAAGVTEGLAGRIRVTRDRLDEAGLTWMATLADDLEEVVGDYQGRSARYQPARLASLLGEVLARRRAVSASQAELDPRDVLGIGERRETTLATVRVVSLGARAFSEGTAREVVVFLADPATGVVLAHRRRWRGTDEALGDAADVAERTVITGLRVRELAMAEAHLRDLRRSAAGFVRWTVFRRGLASAVPLGGPDAVPGRAQEAWRSLPATVRIADVASWAAGKREAVPRLLAPRLATADVLVLEIAAVESITYAPGRQALIARVRDEAGTLVRLVREHRSVAPRALESLALVLPHARLVAGELRATSLGWEMDPCGVVGETLVVPDLERVAPSLAVPLETGVEAAGPLASALLAAGTVLDDAAHLGLSTLPRSWRARADAASAELRRTGFAQLAACLDALAATPDAGGWAEASMRLALTREQMAASG